MFIKIIIDLKTELLFIWTYIYMYTQIEHFSSILIELLNDAASFSYDIHICIYRSSIITDLLDITPPFSYDIYIHRSS